VPGAPTCCGQADPTKPSRVKPIDYKYDYANDVEPQPAEDEGLQLLSGSACDSTAMTDLAARGGGPPPTTPRRNFQKVHRWLSVADPANEDEKPVLLTGEGTLDYGRVRSEKPSTKDGCAPGSSFEAMARRPSRHVGDQPGSAAEPLLRYFAGTWPSSGWTTISIPLSFGYAEEGGALPLPPGSRLGLSLAVGNDTPSGLQIIYDERSFESTLQLETAGRCRLA
jgi:hypothetical protein